MIKALSTHWKYLAYATGAITAVGSVSLLSAYWKRKNHPLVRYAQSIVAADPRIRQDLGSSGKVSLIIHTIDNPTDKEYGFSYKVKGRDGNAQVTVVGDSFTHEELLKLNEAKAALFDKIEDPEEKAKVALEKSAEYSPINIGRFFIPARNPSRVDPPEKVLDPKEKMWRVKDLLIEGVSATRKLESADTLDEILASKYSLQTYADASVRIKESLESFGLKMDKEAETQPRPKPVARYRRKGRIYATIVKICIIPVLGIIIFGTGKKPIATSRPFYVAMSVAKNSGKLKNVIGDNIAPLWVKGMVHNYYGLARFRVHVFGSKGEGTIKVAAAKPLFGKSKTEWRISKIEFQGQNAERFIL